MQTRLIPVYQEQPEGEEAEQILRSCVHCGFCNATCPTYQLLGNELDGPRGRIYLIKQMLEGRPVSSKTRLHLDRCLTCQACETTCPSGVSYKHLLDIGRELVDEKTPRSLLERVQRFALARVISRRWLFASLISMARSIRLLLPSSLRERVPLKNAAPRRNISVPNEKAGRILLLDGCVQDALLPDINAATRQVFSALGYECISRTAAQCCGSVSFHLGQKSDACRQARANIDAWWPLIQAEKVQAIVINASGCGVFVKDYGHLLRDDPAYRDKALKVSDMAKDPIEILEGANWSRLQLDIRSSGIAFHPPCSLQHGQNLQDRVEALLGKLGCELVSFNESHLCCGSAGTYSITQPKLASELKARKHKHIQASGAELVLTANIGCQLHMHEESELPVHHWLQFVANVITGADFQADKS